MLTQKQFDLLKFIHERLKEAGVPATVFGGRETNHNKLNADLGLAEDPATKALVKFVDDALKK